MADQHREARIIRIAAQLVEGQTLKREDLIFYRQNRRAIDRLVKDVKAVDQIPPVPPMGGQQALRIAREKLQSGETLAEGKFTPEGGWSFQILRGGVPIGAVVVRSPIIVERMMFPGGRGKK
jgi:hypothetical protein